MTNRFLALSLGLLLLGSASESFAQNLSPIKCPDYFNFTASPINIPSGWTTWTPDAVGMGRAQASIADGTLNCDYGGVYMGGLTFTYKQLIPAGYTCVARNSESFGGFNCTRRAVSPRSSGKTSSSESAEKPGSSAAGTAQE